MLKERMNHLHIHKSSREYISNLKAFKVLTAVVMKITTFSDILPCSPLKINQHFRGTYHSIFLVSEYAEQDTSMEVGDSACLFNELHGILSQKIVPFTFNGNRKAH
jgi:hypothetical protein